jgi:hypothetical protein
LHNYADCHKYKPGIGLTNPALPAGTIPNAVLVPEQRLSWFVAILPYLEEEGLYRQFDFGAGWDAPANQHLSQRQLRILDCPDWRREASSAQAWETPYVGVAGLGPDVATGPIGGPKIGAFGYDRRVAFKHVKDGISNTLMVLESARETASWAKGGFTTVRGLDPEDKPYLGTGRPFGGTHFSENSLFKGGHSISCNAVMMDGSVRFLNNSISPKVLEALATISGGEKIPEDY